jgi:putative membrane protein
VKESPTPRLSPFAFRLSPFAFRLSGKAVAHHLSGGKADMRHMRLLSLLTIVLLMSACASSDYDSMTSSSTMPMPGALGESDIASIVTAIHQGEIDQGNAALSRANSSGAREFAQMLVTDHTNGLNSARSTFGSLNITPTPNDTSRTLETGSRQTISALSTYNGAAFDRTFVQTHVDGHQWVLNTLDSVLIPSARSAEMRTLLQNQRASVSKHLDHARMLLNSM